MGYIHSTSQPHNQSTSLKKTNQPLQGGEEDKFLEVKMISGEVV